MMLWQFLCSKYLLYVCCGYVLQELNVRELTLATEDSQYGVRLQGEPDNERLGKRLKGEFKKVSQWSKTTTQWHYSVLLWFSCRLIILCWSVLWQVAPAVKTLSSEQLVQFQERGEIVVEGHTLTVEDIKVHVASYHHSNKLP